MIRRYFEAKKLRPQKIVSTMLDLRGRQIRVCHMPAQGVKLEQGKIIRLAFQTSSHPKLSSNELLFIDSPALHQALRGGDRITFVEGKLDAQVLEVKENHDIQVVLQDSGVIHDHCMMRIPGIRLQELPSLQTADKQDIMNIAVKHKFDFVSVPGTISAKDLQEVRKCLGDAKVSVLTTVDSLEALHQFQGTLAYADGVVIVRSELGHELEPEKLVVA
jgi:pyruvate kinase